LGLDGSNRLDIVLMQLVRLTRNGEIVRMSKRTGNAITLTNLLDEISVDAARFFFNFRQSDSAIDFDLDLAVREDSENPVYYVQYAHARICSLINMLASEGHCVLSYNDIKFPQIESDTEKQLIKALAGLPDEISSAAEALDPSQINRYLMDLSGCFHSFYNAEKIRNNPDDILNYRLKLADCTKKVLCVGLSVIGVTAPEKM